ncbi:hypothetical protein C1N32_20605 [Vibrio diazotrophicus]|uniref:Phage tail fibre protein N-terminal domain-containing protein n=1 Tax=Vibrio diazotrophicus TaxID=685 RepID=A0A2J8HSB1_VIBDI|nr:phage tail protein [Vibrio diazotrophicus]PNI01166.1 hypothetical protein C1N32_20605 [Vibrio diazotrophicus]
MANENTDLRCYLTHLGIAAENNAIALGRKLGVIEMVFGSGVLPDASDPRDQESMIQEVQAFPCAMVTYEDDSTLLTFKADIPADVGGFNINEVGIRLEDGTIYGYARGTGDYKPTLEQGATESIRYVVDMYTKNVSTLVTKVDLSNVYADYEDLEAAKKKAQDDLLAHTESPNPHSQYPLSSKAQGLEYDPNRTYYCGDTCYTRVADRTYQWEAYSLEPFSGKDPNDPLNRRAGWTDVTKPFYWKPRYSKVSGETMAWDNDAIPENMVLGIGQQLPVAVYHSLATAKPEWIDETDNALINIPDRRGRFVRAADGTKWLAGKTHEDQNKAHSHQSSSRGQLITRAGGGDGNIWDGLSSTATTSEGGQEAQPKGYIEWVGYAL